MRFLLIISAAVTTIAGPSLHVRANGVQVPTRTPITGELTSQGCFKSVGQLVDPKNYETQLVSRGHCQDHVCNTLGSLVLATKGNACFCGNSYPPQSDKVDDSFCNFPCPSFPQEACGAINTGSGSYYSVYNTGKEVDVPFDGSETSPSGSSTPSPTNSSAGSESSGAKSEKSGPNIGGIVGGVVVAVVVVAAIVGGAFFYIRRKRNKEIEEEHRRNAAVSAFVGKPPSSSGGLSISDSRLDPVMAQRRLSDGSIADNQDYSRKILRVTNA